MKTPRLPSVVLPLVVTLGVAACSNVGTPAGTTNASSDAPAAIAVPSGNRPALTLKGSGLQNYECRAKAGAAGGYDWVLVGPEAVLRDANDAIVGRHFAGPVWEYGDGSRVAGRVVADTPSPTSGNIAWLLLQGTPSGAGALAGVTYVQRTNTSGGTAPSDVCSAQTSGTKRATRYTADYVFWKA